MSNDLIKQTLFAVASGASGLAGEDMDCILM
jgi:hypothetical protein